MTYILHVYGGSNIQETTDEFDTKTGAKEEAEFRSSSDSKEWEHTESGDSEVLIDPNG